MLSDRWWSLIIAALAVGPSVARSDSNEPRQPDRPGPHTAIRLEVFSHEIRFAALWPDGSLLALGGDIGELTIWQTKDGRFRSRLRGTPPGAPAPDEGGGMFPDPDYREWPLAPIVFDATGAMVALNTSWGSNGGLPASAKSMNGRISALGTSIEVWRLADGRKVADLKTDNLRVHLLGFERSGSRVVAIDSMSRATTWDLAADRKIAEFDTGPDGAIISYIDFSPGASAIDPAANHAVSVLPYYDDPPPVPKLRLWDYQARTLRFVDPRERGWIGPNIIFGAVALSVDGCQVAAAATDSTIHLIDFATATTVSQFTIDEGFAQGYLAFRPDGRQLIALNEEGEVRVYDMGTKELIWSAKGAPGQIRALHWSDERVLVVTGGLQREAKIEPITLSTYAIPHP